jgi:class 3 adenylate cyclase/tetratricopeptide (TPR) repeat protein
MKCARCQHVNRPGAKFCEECAAPLVRVCANCGVPLSATAKFCSECAHPTGRDAPTAAQRFGAPEVYTPKHLAEKILTSKAALEGERKHVTVLFADLKGSMELLADRDPEEARNILDPVLERMMEAVHRYEGTVNQVMGDGIMALFGAPLAHEDHAVRACYAALRMQELVKRYAEDARHAHGVNVQIRVGLNSGEVVVRAVGSDLHMDYTAVGQTTHLAARMEQFASPGSVLLTASTLELVEGYVAVKALGPVPVKGLAEAVEVYEAMGTGPARTRLQASARRGLTRFVGRDAEVEQIRRAQQLAGDGHGQLAAVVGEAGVGKSRLLYEFARSHRLQGWLILEAASVSYGKATSYLPVIDLLKGYFKIQDRDDVRDIREKVTGKVLALDRALEPALPALLALLDVAVDDASWQTLDPGQRRQRTLDAVKRLLLREAREQPLLLIFEDLHWIDGETQALLDSLVESLGSARVLVLVNYRPEYQHAWGGKTYYSQMRLDALAVESAGELLDALLGDDPGLAPLKQLLGKRGNPFFLEESVRTLIETKALVGERGRYRLVQPIQTIQVPATVHAVLAARIDRLAPDEKRLLQVASVVGKDVPSALLQAIADLPDEALRVGLDRLQGAEFLYEMSLFPEVEYTFKHALTHEVTYQSLLHERRRALHARVVDAIEGYYCDRLAEQVELLAHHALHGEVWDKALAYLRQAGAKAFARSANQEAVGYFEQALEVLRQFPEQRETLEHAIDVRIDLRHALNSLGEFSRMHTVLREAEALAEPLGDQPRLGRVSAFLTMSLFNLGADRAVESGQRALAIGSALGDVGLQVSARYYLGLAYHHLGDYERAIESFSTIVHVLEGELSGERFGMPSRPSVQSRARLIISLADVGEFAEARRLADETTRMADAFNEVFGQALAYAAVGELCLARGQFPRAISALERSLAHCDSVPLFFSSTLACLGYVRALTGNVSDALPLLEQGAASGLHQAGVRAFAVARVRLGEGHLLAGRMDDAARAAHEALASSRERKLRGTEAWCLRLLGEIASHRDPRDIERAEQHFREGLALATELRMRPLVAHCYLGLGKLYRHTGKRAQAEERVATATTMYRDMGMTYWLEKAEAEIRDLA